MHCLAISITLLVKFLVFKNNLYTSLLNITGLLGPVKKSHVLSELKTLKNFYAVIIRFVKIMTQPSYLIQGTKSTFVEVNELFNVI